MKIVYLFITVALSAFCTAAEYVRGVDANRKLTASGHSGYKYIQVFNKDSHKYQCWEAVQSHGYYYVQAKDCSSSNQYQDWYYTEHGELKNRKYDGYCVHYDIENKHPNDYITLEECDGGSHQAWNYIEKHFVSKYDGYCVDLCRRCGSYFEMKQCYDNDYKDQIQEVEGY